MITGVLLSHGTFRLIEGTANGLGQLFCSSRSPVVEKKDPGTEAKILRIFKKVMSKRIDGVNIDWGKENQDEEQAPSVFSLFEGESVSILARMKNSARPVNEITLSFGKGGDNRKITIPVHNLPGGESPVGLLWAKERIRDLEEGTFQESQRGSKQGERREKKIRDEIITLSREFGILSRETSFVAIEKRMGDQKTMTEVILRRVPVMLTKGWGGMEVRGQFSAYLAATPMQYNLRSAEFSSTLGAVKAKESASWFFEKLSAREKAAKQDDYDLLLRILSSQRAEGGFNIDDGLALSIGISMTDLKKASNKMSLRDDKDRFILLSTAIILELLKKHFADKRSMWEGLIEKTEKWFQREISNREPKIDGVLLEDWAAQFIKTLILRKVS